MDKQQSQSVYDHRRDVVFLFVSGLFLACMVMLNVVGLTRFVSVFNLQVAVGVLFYPITFLCTDFISEVYGKKKANLLVWAGLFVNIFVLLFVFIGHILPSVPLADQPPWQTLFFSKEVIMPTGTILNGEVQLFDLIYACTAGSILASMLAYLFAQFFDVYIFHRIKRLTRGKMLWLRNNLSTLSSQFVDSIIVTSITSGVLYFANAISLKTIGLIFVGNYAFKFAAALLDTIPFILLVKYVGKYLGHGPSMKGSRASGYVYSARNHVEGEEYFFEI